MTPTQRFLSAIMRGQGTPWQHVWLTDTKGRRSRADFRLSPTPRAVDGHFYSLKWKGQRIRLTYPALGLPWSYRMRRTRLAAYNQAGQFLGAFEVAPVLEDRQVRMGWAAYASHGRRIHLQAELGQAACGSKITPGFVGSVNKVTCDRCWSKAVEADRLAVPISV